MELEYKYIPQKIYEIDGIPANKYGEWPGIHSNHWKGSIKIIHQEPKEKIFDPKSTMPILGKIHYKEKHGIEKESKIGKKQFPQQKYREAIEAKIRGIKQVPQITRKEKECYNTKDTKQIFTI